MRGSTHAAILEDLALDVVDLLGELLPVGREEQVVVGEVGGVTDSDELEDASEEGTSDSGSQSWKGWLK